MNLVSESVEFLRGGNSEQSMLPETTNIANFDMAESPSQFASEKEKPSLGKTHKIIGTFASIKQTGELDLPNSLQEESVEESAS